MEKLIAFHCAPALAGIKPSNIINCLKENYSNPKCEISRLNDELNCKGIYIEILCECDKRILIMVYRKDRLIEYLHKKEIIHFLEKEGYPLNECPELYIERLKKKIGESNCFPHEIGAFLGYPIHDIYGFIEKDKCIYTGYWKVYADLEIAKEKFKQYDICRKAVLKRITSGQKLCTIFKTA